MTVARACLTPSAKGFYVYYLKPGLFRVPRVPKQSYTTSQFGVAVTKLFAAKYGYRRENIVMLLDEEEVDLRYAPTRDNIVGAPPPHVLIVPDGPCFVASRDTQVGPRRPIRRQLYVLLYVCHCSPNRGTY